MSSARCLLKVAGDAHDGPLLLGGGALPAAAALEEGDLQPVDAGAELLVVHGLQDVVRDLQAQGLPAVGEVVVAGDDDIGGFGVLYAAELDDLQAVHYGNVDVHYDDVGAQCMNRPAQQSPC